MVTLVVRYFVSIGIYSYYIILKEARHFGRVRALPSPLLPFPSLPFPSLPFPSQRLMGLKNIKRVLGLANRKVILSQI